MPKGLRSRKIKSEELLRAALLANRELILFYGILEKKRMKDRKSGLENAVEKILKNS